jgi:hypothetical protein
VKRAILAAVLVGFVMSFASPARASGGPILVTGNMADALGPDYASRVWAVSKPGGGTQHEVLEFTSLDAFRAATLPPGTTVMYDIEYWPATPTRQFQHPIRSMRSFVAEAHARGLVAMLVPSRFIVRRDASCPQRRHETVFGMYLRCIAPIPTDYLLVQVQSIQCNTVEVRREIAAIAARQPGQVIAELSVNRSPTCVTVPRLVRDAQAVLGVAELSLWGLPPVVGPTGRPAADQLTMAEAFFAAI